MRILVTGGAGFIGSHVVDLLLGQGHTVTVVDDLSSGSLDNLAPEASFEKVDICSDRLRPVFHRGRFEAVYHLAAQMDVRKSVADPLFDLNVNIGGSVKLLQLCQEYQVGKFIFSSTGGAIYGEQDCFPADEKHPQRPVSPYGISKLAVEKYLFYFFNEFGINCTALRYANVYGPRQNPHGEAGVVAIFNGKLLAGEQAFIWGDGLQTRDYIYVGDIARLNLLALGLDGFNVMNAGTGIETNVVELFAGIAEAAGSLEKPLHKPPAQGEQRRSCIDASYARERLGWEPQVPLSQGLGLTTDYFRRKLEMQ